MNENDKEPQWVWTDAHGRRRTRENLEYMEREKERESKARARRAARTPEQWEHIRQVALTKEARRATRAAEVMLGTQAVQAAEDAAKAAKVQEEQARYRDIGASRAAADHDRARTIWIIIGILFILGLLGINFGGGPDYDCPGGYFKSVSHLDADWICP